MQKPTKEEIAAEIQALEACKAYIPKKTVFGDDNLKRVDLQIEFLRGDIDMTNDDEWNEFSDDEQSIILDAKRWKDGDTKESPSSGWNSYKPK